MNPIERLIQEVTVCLTCENISKPIADAMKIALFDAAHWTFPINPDVETLDMALEKEHRRKGRG